VRRNQRPCRVIDQGGQFCRYVLWM
jgi:hypothetical protein